MKDSKMLVNVSDPIADNKIGVALICSRKLILGSFCALLSRHGSAFSIWPFCSTESFLQDTQEEVPDFDLVLYDAGARCLDDPAGTLSNDLDSVSERISGAPITILGDLEDWGSIVKALLLPGVRGYIPTTLDPQVAVRALFLISAGGSFMPAHYLTPVGQHTLPPTATSGLDARGSSHPGREDVLGCLTKRELEVLEKLRHGKSNKVIAYELNLGEATVKVHVRNILKKLGATNRTQAAMTGNRLLAQA